MNLLVVLGAVPALSMLFMGAILTVNCLYPRLGE